jgi:hypothetical protein
MAEHDQDDVRAQLELEARIHWQVYRARETRWVRGVEVPAGHYWAVHWRAEEPPAVAADLGALERAVVARTPQRSIMRELLTPDQVRHLEVGEGRYFLPGPPP